MDEIMGWDEDKISCFSIEIWDSWAFMCLVGLPLGQSSVTCMSSHTKQPFNGCCFDKLMHWCISELSLSLLSRPSSHSSRLAAVNKAVCIAKCLSVIYHKHNLCQYSQYQSIETILCRPNPIRIKWMTTCPTRTSPNHLTMRKIRFFPIQMGLFITYACTFTHGFLVGRHRMSYLCDRSSMNIKILEALSIVATQNLFRKSRI